MTDNEQFIKLTKMFMILTGLWLKPLDASPLINKLNIMYATLIRVLLIIICLSLIVELIRLIVQQYELDVIISSFSVVISVMKIQVKFIIFLKNKVYELYDVPIQTEEEIWQCDDNEIKEQYSTKVKVCKYFMIAQIMGSMFTISALNISGVFGNAKLIEYNRLHNASLETHLMYQLYFPVNKLDHLASFYSVMTVTAYCAFLYNSVSHMLFTTLLIFSATKLEILQIKMRKLIASYRSPEENNKMLKQLILEHASAIEFVTTLNVRTMNILMVEFMLSSLDVASVAANILKADVSDLTWWGIFFLLLTMQILALTWNANEIKEQSLAIADGIFQSDWYVLDKDSLQLIQIMIMRSQRPLIVTIGPFGPMTTNSALVIFKAAYSYVSIMK